MFKATAFLAIALVEAVGPSEHAPSLWRGDPLPESARLLCRGGEFDKPPPPEVPPPLEIEYSKPKAWVRVTFGGEVFEASHPMLKDGPLAWGGAGKNYDWDVNVVAGSGMRGWSWFKLADDRLDWKGFCEIAP